MNDKYFGKPDAVFGAVRFSVLQSCASLRIGRLHRPGQPDVLATSRQRRPHTGAETATGEPRVGPTPTPAPAMTQEAALSNKGIEQPPSPSQWRMDFRKIRLGSRSQSVPEITTYRNARQAAQMCRG